MPKRARKDITDIEVDKRCIEVTEDKYREREKRASKGRLIKRPSITQKKKCQVSCKYLNRNYPTFLIK